MRAEEQFDSFYLKTRRALVHQTFALTGDLAAAQRAVRDAYVLAWHHWRKVQAVEDPRDWVRPRAWALAQRRHTARLWQRTRDLSPEDRAVLDALHKLPSAERRALLLVQLAGVPLDVAARELNVTQAALEQQLQSATAGMAVQLDQDSSTVRAPLLALGEAASRAVLPRPAAVRREGRRRRRTHALVGAAAATFLAVGSGAFAHQPVADQDAGTLAITPTAPDGSPADRPSTSPTPESTLPSADDLLDVDDAKRLTPKGKWSVTATHDNTSGEGINYVCQQQRFADPEGLATLVRTLESSRGATRSVVQVVEISESAAAASATYDTIASWFAGCEDGELQLKQAYAVDGIAERAMLLELESWDTPRSSYTVGVAEVGQVVTTTVVDTVNGRPPKRHLAARTLAASSRMICERAGRSDCGGRPEVRPVPPDPSGQAPGILATLDMPPMAGVSLPWVATQTESTRTNPAATRCDKAAFRRAGAVRSRTRTFFAPPEARLPDQFGLTETTGEFRDPRAAKAFLRAVRERMASCEERDLATEVEAPRSLREGLLDGSTWRLRTEVSENRDVVFDVGFVRRGRHVAQLLFVPAGRADLRPGDFRALVIRAGERLREVE